MPPNQHYAVQATDVLFALDAEPELDHMPALSGKGFAVPPDAGIGRGVRVRYGHVASSPPV
jgi:hypothetical protein